MNKTPRITITMKSEILRKTDEMRGNINRSQMISRAVVLGLAQIELQQKSPVQLSSEL